MVNTVLDKIQLLDKHWGLIGTKKYPHRRLKRDKLQKLIDTVGTVQLPPTANLCRGARKTGKNFDGKLNQPAMWFAHDSKLCRLENRERVFFYRPKNQQHPLTLLDLREKEKQAGFKKALATYKILYGDGDDDHDYDYQRDSIVPAMLYRKLYDDDVHGWIAYDDQNELEVLIIKPKKYLKQKFAGKPHSRLPKKKRILSDGRDV